MTETDTSPSGANGPRAIGPYRLVRLAGEGGMGSVWLAEQEQPHRQVALKVARGALPSLAERMRREIDTLAALEHPNIARLYAAGEARIDGVDTPWLAMEYVRGIDLLAYARTAQCDLAARLRLLVEIARTVQFAHDCGVIHRDLKPGNILVDENGRTKILDFGIAHRLGDEMPGLTLAGQVLGTLPYMSPEQLSRGDRGADARSDVYSLGAIAYELIAGRLPHPGLATATLFAALDILRREPAPSLVSVTEAARGDLDTVVMKAIAAEPERRYATAAAFADDLQRVLDRRPVAARPPTAAYRAARFVHRHRALSAAAAAVFVILLAASMVSLRFALSERDARAEAERHAQESTAVNAFLQQMLASANPESTGGRNPTVAQIIDEAERGLDGLSSQPSVLRAVAATLASARRALGDYKTALALSDRALAVAGTESPAQREALLRERATILIELARFDEARATLALTRAAWPDAPMAVRLDIDLEATRIDSDEGRTEDAERGLRALLAQAQHIEPGLIAGDRDLQTTLATARSSLSTLLRESGKLDEAESLTRDVLAWRRATFGDRAPTTLTSRHNLALILAARGDYSAAEKEARATLGLQREVLGDAHSSTLTSWQTLANVLVPQGKFEEAEAAARASMDGFVREAGEAHVQALAAMNSLAYILEERHHVDEAEALYRRIIAVQQRAGSRHPSAFAPRNNLAMLLMDAHRYAAADREFASLVDDARASVGSEHLMTAIFMSNRGLCQTRMGHLADARTTLEAAHAQLHKLVGADHARTRTAAERLADVYDRIGEHDKATALRPAKSA